MNREHLLLQNMLSILNRNRDMNSGNEENIRNENNNNNSSFSTFFSGLLFSGLQSYLQQDRAPLVNHIQHYVTRSNIDRVMEIVQEFQQREMMNQNAYENNENNENNEYHFHYEYNDNNDDIHYAYQYEAYVHNNQESKESKENRNNEYNGKIIIPCELEEKERERYSQYDSCSICFESFNLSDPSLSIALTECKHAYHLLCINEWFKRKKDCPVCRKSL